MIGSFVQLALRTLQQPRVVAEEIMAMSLSRAVLWQGLVLAVVLNTLVYQLTLIASPPPGPIPPLFASPMLFGLLVGGGLIVSVYALTRTGRALGGTGTLEMMLALLVWLQFLRLAVQVLAFFFIPILPGLTGLLVLAASLYGFWLLLNFVDVGHGFNNMMTSVGVLVLTFLAVMFALILIMSLIGPQNLGIAPYA